MIKVIILLITIIVFPKGNITPQSHLTTLFHKRASNILSQYDTVTTPDYYACAVQYIRREHTERADSNALKLLQKPAGDVFWMLACMTMYLHGEKVMANDVKNAVRYAWKTYWPYRGDTENHWIMYYSSLLLAAERWPNLHGNHWFNGLNSEENYEDAKEYLRMKFLSVAQEGFIEFDSPTYVPFVLGAMLLLRDFAKDSMIKTCADMMCDYILAEFAVHHLNGQYAGGHSRSTDRVALNPLEANTAGIASLYFDAPLASRTQMEVIAALSSYEVPEIIYKLATDRSKPYVHTKSNPMRDILRFDNPDMEKSIVKYTYMTSNYALSSLTGGIHPIQQRTWGLNISIDQQAYSLFGLHPTWSEKELGMFFPEETKSLIDEVTLSKSFYTNPMKIIGASLSERVFQFRNTQIALYNIEVTDVNKSISTFIPSDADTTIYESNGWILQRFGNVFTALFPLQPYLKAHDQSHERLTSTYLRNGTILEVRSDEEIGSFTKFRSELQKSKPIFDSSNITVEYVTLEGKRLEFTWSTNLITEKRGYRSSDHSYENQAIKYKGSVPVVEISYQGKILVLDFNEPRKYYR